MFKKWWFYYLCIMSKLRHYDLGRTYEAIMISMSWRKYEDNLICVMTNVYIYEDIMISVMTNVWIYENIIVSWQMYEYMRTLWFVSWQTYEDMRALWFVMTNLQRYGDIMILRRYEDIMISTTKISSRFISYSYSVCKLDVQCLGKEVVTQTTGK